MRNLGDLNNWTKTELAQVIVQDFLNLPHPARKDSFKVRQMSRRNKQQLIEQCERSIERIAHRGN
jgi:hypothetical protein